jgi:hypothetical protein
VKRIFAIFMVALCMVAMMVVMAAPAFARITESGNQGHLDTNPAGNCPAGQQEEPVTPGAQKKCD